MSLRRKRKYRIFSTPRFFNRFRIDTDARRFAGNSVTLLPNGGDFFSALVEEISRSTATVTLEFYIIRDDCAGRTLAGALADAASRGISVHLLYDHFGCIETPSLFFRDLQEAGVSVLSFNPLGIRTLHHLDRRNHRKVAVIDGRIAFLGGLNIGEEYTGFGESVARWRDVGLTIEGPAVGELQRQFWEIWAGQGGVLPHAPLPPPALVTGDAEVIIVSGSPHSTRSFIRGAFRMALAGASETVKVLNPYFIPGPRVVRSLLRAAARGVRVQLILPAVSDVPLVRVVSRGYFHPLLKAGVEIYERQGTVLHAKVMLIDDCWTMIGSSNLDLRSFHRNFEVNVIVDSREFGEQVDEMIALDLAKSRRITIEEHQSRPWFARFMEIFFSPLSRFL